MNDLLIYYPTKGGYVKMPDYRPEEDLDFLPILDPKQTSTKAIQVESSISESQACTIVDPNEVMLHLDDEDIFSCLYNENNSENETVNVDDFPDEPDESDDINLTYQIQATLDSTEEFKEYVVETDNIDGDHNLSEGQEFVEKLFVGKQWLSKEHCRDYLKNLALDLNHSIVQVRNKKKQQEYKCKDETCPWRVYCSVLSDKQTFECNKGHFIHTCEEIHGIKHPLANARWVAKVMLESFKAHPNYKPRDFQTEVKKNHKVEISYYTAWHAYHLCNEKILGSYEEGYSLLHALCDQLLKENPTNIVKLTTDPLTKKFKSLCVAYRVSLDGFVKSARPILELDGFHLSGKYGGTLLAITCLDGNNGIFLIAIYICESECKEELIHFLSLVAEELKAHPRALTFISDKQNGLIEGVAVNFSDMNHYHRYCFRHIYKNFKKLHPRKNLEFMTWRAARSFSEVGHKIWMDRLIEAKESAPEWFDIEPVETWERAYIDRSSG
ncbi:hypothetical protein MKX03_003094 [Papaver bracteatum]|nr:hypothetical protein MKX03_003094 [Papaver bracteatum]